MSEKMEPSQEVPDETSLENPSLKKILDEHTIVWDDGKRYFPWDTEIKGFAGDYVPKKGVLSIEEQDEETLMRTIREHTLEINGKTYLDSDVEWRGWVEDKAVPRKDASPIELPEESEDK